MTFGHFIYIKLARVPHEEAANMRFVRRSTSIPVPRVWAAFHLQPRLFWWRRKWSWDKTADYPHDAFLFMTRVPGKPLDMFTWLKLDKDAQDRIIIQLRQYFEQLRSLKPPPNTIIGSVNGSGVCDARLEIGWPRDKSAVIDGPFQDEAELNAFIRMQRPLTDFNAAVNEAHNRTHALVFTHGDLALRNIMVKGDTITGLIDWESAGWFPEHWEYLKVYWSPDLHPMQELWLDRVKEIIQPYELENTGDRELIKGLHSVPPTVWD